MANAAANREIKALNAATESIQQRLEEARTAVCTCKLRLGLRRTYPHCYFVQLCSS